MTEFFPEAESVTLEFKLKLPTELRKIYRTVVAFANRFGGRIIIGVADSRAVTGLTEKEAHSILESISNSIYESCSPPILPTVYTQRFGQSYIVVIEVFAGNQKPYYVKALGPEAGVFIRTGRSTVLATSDLRDQLAWEARGKSPDARPLYHLSNSVIDSKLFSNFLEKRKRKAIVSDLDAALTHYEILVTEQGRLLPTLGGVLLFSQSPQRYSPESFLNVTEYEGDQGRTALASRDFEGSLIEQYLSAYNFILSRLSFRFSINKMEREEESEVPEIAIREVLVNALVHRNYLIAAPTKVSIYPNRLEVFSPGSFPGPLTQEHLQSGFSYIRNSVITRVFREIGLIEKLGSGFVNLFESYKLAGLLTPTIDASGEFVKCILPRARGSSANDKRAQSPNHRSRSLELPDLSIEPNQVFTTKELAALWNVSRPTAVRYVAAFVEQGQLERIGRGPATRYRYISG